MFFTFKQNWSKLLTDYTCTHESINLWIFLINLWLLLKCTKSSTTRVGKIISSKSWHKDSITLILVFFKKTISTYSIVFNITYFLTFDLLHWWYFLKIFKLEFHKCKIYKMGTSEGRVTREWYFFNFEIDL